ncbi:DUF2226 domain-containing protein [Candidatus Micrarchaeota archaeon]|nr:DUF2226 domain-containing protein [Candidatus Micrarchaeota archaeon]
MNLPSGKILKTNLDTSSTDFLALVDELRRKRFNGYVALSIKGQAGVEEGTILVDTGKIVGATYEYYAFDRELSGEKAFQRLLNAAAYKNGIIDAVELTAEQVHLALAFHEDAVFVPSEESLRHIKLGAFSPFFEEEVRKLASASVDATAAETGNQNSGPGKKYKMYDLTKTDAPKAGMPEGKHL